MDAGESQSTRFISAESLATFGLTFLAFPLAWLLRHGLGMDEAEYLVGATMFYLAHVINDPHFSVTYVLFYRRVRERLWGDAWDRPQRVRYALAGFVAPAVLVCWAIIAIATHSAQTLGFMVQLMFLLVGWHYAKQGFGMLTVLSGRRGVRFTHHERRVILGHCYAAWAFAWANPAQVAGNFVEKGVVYWAPAHPRWLEIIAGAILTTSALLLAHTLYAKWRREGHLPLVAVIGFLTTIWLWTIYTRLDPLVQYVIPALHSVQYLYFVWLMTKNETAAAEGPPTFGPPVRTRIVTLSLTALLLGWFLFRGAPQFFDALWTSGSHGSNVRNTLGDTPFFAAFFVVVNIHHYFMDSVLWRRENPQTSYLYATPQREPIEATHAGQLVAFD